MTDIESIAARRMSAREKVSRDDQIVTARMRDRSWASIAAEHNLSVRQCQSVVAAYRKANPTPRHRDPLELLDELLEALQGVQEELAEISATTTHDATRVGAIRSRMDAMHAQMNLLALVGVLPRDLGQLPMIEDAREVAAIFAVFDTYGVPDEAAVAVLDAVEGRAPSHPEDRPG